MTHKKKQKGQLETKNKPINKMDLWGPIKVDTYRTIRLIVAIAMSSLWFLAIWFGAIGVGFVVLYSAKSFSMVVTPGMHSAAVMLGDIVFYADCACFAYSVIQNAWNHVRGK